MSYLKAVAICDKPELNSYSEKVPQERITPVLQKYGGDVTEGFIAVSASNTVMQQE